jgi:hypothetical protein
MKRLILVLLGFLALNLAKAQTSWEDIIYLKNGSVIRGTITNQEPNKSITVTTNDGQTFTFDLDKIDKMSKERKSDENGRTNGNAGKKSMADENENGYKPNKYHHIIRAGLSFSPGFMFKQDQVNFYVSGDLEYYIAPKVSIVSTTFYFLNSNMSSSMEDSLLNKGGMGPILKMNHKNFTGFRYHLLKDKMFDPFIGLQPGFSICQTNDNYYDESIRTYGFIYGPPRRDTRISFDPMLSIDLGFNVYAVKFFHLFVNGRYAMGRHLGGLKPYSLNELSFSFGLGLNANFWNQKNKKQR